MPCLYLHWSQAGWGGKPAYLQSPPAPWGKSFPSRFGYALQLSSKSCSHFNSARAIGSVAGRRSPQASLCYQMSDPKVVTIRAQLREAKSDAKREREVKTVMEGLLIKTGKRVAREESAKRKHSWKKEQIPKTSSSPCALATKPAHTVFQLKAGKNILMCKRAFGSKQVLRCHRQQQYTAMEKCRLNALPVPTLESGGVRW